MKTKFMLLLFLMNSLFFACTSMPEIKNAESDAEVIYKTGKHHLENENYEQAELTFMKVITDFSFSKYEPLATIGLADTYFGREEYASATEVFRRFLKMRPNHEKADYATFQIANCHFEQRPSDFIILPDPDEKDLSIVQKAVTQYQLYLKQYPNGKYVKEAKEMLAKAEGMLISRELKVAKFYYNQEKCKSVNMRLEYIKKHYKVSSEEVKAEISKLEQACKEKK